MSRLSRRVIPMLLSVACAAVSYGQPEAHARFLRERGLDDVYAEYLVQQLESAAGAKRAEIAQELAGVYLDLLQDDSETRRQMWAERAATLLRSVPEADSPELRLGLAQAAYLEAEETAERSVLLLASEREVADAIRILREVSPTFLGLAQQSHQRAEQLERQLGKRLERAAEDEISAQLAEARRMRSIAFYYAGWSSLYTAELSGTQGPADQALRHFGWILGARDGEEARVDQVQPSLLRFEHVARSAVGAAIACSLSGRSLEAQAWLDAVERSTDAPIGVREAVPSRRIRVLASAGAWPDFDTIARRRLVATVDAPDATFARLVGILSLQRVATPGGRHGQLVRRVAQDALAYLVRAGEIGHVTDLARRFGTDLLDAEGFVSVYVRAVMAREEVRTFAEAHGADDPRVVEALLDAAEKLASASSSPDADRFPVERARALFDAGQCLLEAARLAEAADVFERCQAIASSSDQRRQAAWMRVVALERAADDGDASLAEARDQAALLYLAAYPDTDEAAQLALRPSTARLLTENQAVEILLSVPSTAPTHASARRRAAALLYRRYRSADALSRPLVAVQFMSLSEEILAQDSRTLRRDSSEEIAAVAESMVLTARRLADVAMSVAPPDVDRAEFALGMIDRVVSFTDSTRPELVDELAFRRLQIASHLGEDDVAAQLADQLAGSDGSFAAVAAQVMYRDSVRAWIDDQSSRLLAERVVRFGVQVMDSLADRPAALASVLQTVASAADVLAAGEQGDASVQISVDARRRLVELGLADEEQLRALAAGYARLDDAVRSAETWLTVLQRAEPNSLAWYEARLRSLEQLEQSDQEQARDAARQFQALHPELGPPKYRAAFRELLARLVGPAGGGAG